MGTESSFRVMNQVYCGLEWTPFYGQCQAPLLAIAAGSIGVVVAVLGMCSSKLNQKYITGFAVLLGLGAFGTGVAAFAISFFRFEGASCAESSFCVKTGSVDVALTCEYSFGTSTALYKAMSVTALVAAIGGLFQAIYEGYRYKKNNNRGGYDSSFSEFM